MAATKAPGTPVTRLKRKLEGNTPSSAATKRARQDDASKSPPTRDSPRLRRTPAQVTPSAETDVDISFVTAASEIEEETPKAKAPASKNGTPENGWTELKNIASAGLTNGKSEAELEKAARRRKRKDEKKARRAAKKESADEASTLADGSAKPEKGKESKHSKPSKEKKRAGEQPDEVVATADVTTEQPSDWALTSPTAGRYLDQDPIFIRDASGKEGLIAAKDYEVQLCSLESSLVQTSQKAPAGLRIAHVASSEGGDGIVHIGYSDGSLAQWDTRNNSINPSSQPRHLSPHVMAIKKKSSHADEIFSLATVNDHTEIRLDGKPIFESKTQLFSLRHVREAPFVLGLGRFAIVLGRRKEGGSAGYTWIELPVRRSITCGDARVVHKKKSKDILGLQVAVGNIDGQIHFYDNLTSLFSQSSPSLPNERVLHWHTEPVCALRFSPDGNYLFSGGRETVLVLWQLTTGKKHFLPHLTSTIERITVNGTGDRIAMQMGDNSIMVLSTSELKPLANFAGLQVAQPVFLDAAWKTSQHCIVLDPTNQNQVLAAVPATQPRLAGDISARPFLQTYDVRDGRHISRQALSRNNVTDFRLGPNKEPIYPPDVSQVQISGDGQWLATIDEWMPPVADTSTLSPQDDLSAEEKSLQRREVYLKFWSWDSQENIWTLITRSDSPHARSDTAALGAGKVLSLVSDPSSNNFATLGEDGIVRIWTSRLRDRAEVTAQHSKNGIVESKTWFCKRMIQLPQDVDTVDSPMAEQEEPSDGPRSGHLAFSEDGSMLVAALNTPAIEQDCPLHFIHVSTGEVVTKAIPVPQLVESLAFVDRYLIAVGRKMTHIWDYVENALKCRLAVPNDAAGSPLFAVNRANKTFAVAAGRELSIYKLGDDERIHGMTLEQPLMALLANQRGYILLFSDATVRRLLPTSLLEKDQATTDADGLMTDVAGGSEETSVDLVNKLSKTTLTAETRGGAAVEDDRPVVRPQQLANALDAAGTVEDMFQAVFGLFGRRPRQRPIAVST